MQRETSSEEKQTIELQLWASSLTALVIYFQPFSSSNNKWIIDLTISLLTTVAFWRTKSDIWSGIADTNKKKHEE